MSFGVRTYAADGVTVLFDSLTAIGGVIGDYRNYASGAAGETINYPQWAGRTALFVDCGGAYPYVTLTTSAGYPSITVSSPGGDMAFALVVY